MATHLNQEKEAILKSRDAAQFTVILQQCQVPTPALISFTSVTVCLNGDVQFNFLFLFILEINEHKLVSSVITFFFAVKFWLFQINLIKYIWSKHEKCKYLATIKKKNHWKPNQIPDQIRDTAVITVILLIPWQLYLFLYILSQALKAGMTNVQLLIDFLCQSGPRVVGGKNQALRYKHNTFAEKLGDIRQQWLHLEGELESQVCSTATNTQIKTLTWMIWN